MIRASTVTLYADTPTAHGVYSSVPRTGREVMCDVQSVSRAEMYDALSRGMRPVWVLVLSDYAEYNDEIDCLFEGKQYRIIRTYVRNDHRIELTIERMTGV